MVPASSSVKFIIFQTYALHTFTTTCLLVRIITAFTEVQSNLCSHLEMWELVCSEEGHVQSLCKYLSKYIPRIPMYTVLLSLAANV